MVAYLKVHRSFRKTLSEPAYHPIYRAVCISPARVVPGGAYVFMQNIVTSYLEWKGTYAPRASTNYKIWLERFMAVCGNKPVEEYTVSDVVKFRRWLEARYSPYTVSFATIVLKNFLQFCKTQNYSCLSPTLVRLPRISAKSHRAVTEAEFNRIIAEIPTNEFRPLRDSVMIRMLWDTGVRISELCDMDISQITEGKRSAVIRTKKNGKPRIIVWSEETQYYLNKYMPMRLELSRINNATALFVGRNKAHGWSSRLTCRSVQRTIKFFVGRAGIQEKITPHSFRHGWAHKRRDHNAPLAFIQKGLGHLHPMSTFVYEQYNDLEFERNASAYLKMA